MKPETKRLLAIIGRNATVIAFLECCLLAGNMAANSILLKPILHNMSPTLIMGGAYSVLLYTCTWLISGGKNPFKMFDQLCTLIAEHEKSKRVRLK